MTSSEVDSGYSRIWLDYVLEHNRCIPLCMVVDISVCRVAFCWKLFWDWQSYNFISRILNVRL